MRQQASIPDSWTASTVTRIHKQEEPTVTSNYRPVGTPIARLHASVLNNRISVYFETESLRAQRTGGLPHRSVIYNLFVLIVLVATYHRKFSYYCFVDLTAAFHCVLTLRALSLWERLCACGVSGRMLAGVQSLHSDAQIMININGCIGFSQMPVNGVKQDCR